MNKVFNSSVFRLLYRFIEKNIRLSDYRSLFEFLNNLSLSSEGNKCKWQVELVIRHSWDVVIEYKLFLGSKTVMSRLIIWIDETINNIVNNMGYKHSQWDDNDAKAVLFCLFFTISKLQRKLQKTEN